MPHPQDKAIAHVATLSDGELGDPSWRVTLHFHPDRLVAGTPILRLMAQDAAYRSQFETGTGKRHPYRRLQGAPTSVTPPGRGSPHARGERRRTAEEKEKGHDHVT